MSNRDMVEENKIIVFLASSLPLKEAKEILPNAYYMPPVQCGDILAVLRLKPKIIVVIDGLFESTAAVWHKEILFAIEKGVQVFGAASMGALRAAELEDFGMIGVGEIFQAYASGSLIDDDEVAVLHGPKENKYKALTLAMVNIRATLEKAIEEKILTTESASLLIDLSKKIPYQKRTFRNIITRLNIDGEGSSSSEPEIMNEFIKWYNEGNFVNQKRLDAVALLNHIANSDSNRTDPEKEKKIEVNRSAFLRVLQKDIMCEPFPSYHDWLPEEEKFAIELKKNSEVFHLIKKLAYLLSAVDSLKTEDITDNAALIERCKILTLSGNLFENRQEKTEALVQALEKSSDKILSTEYYLHALMRISGAYKKYKSSECFKKNEPLIYQINSEIAKKWRIIDGMIKTRELNPTPKSLQNYMILFCQKHKLTTNELLMQWLRDVDLDQEGFNHLMAIASLFNSVVMQNSLDILGVSDCNSDVWWLMEAIKLIPSALLK